MHAAILPPRSQAGNLTQALGCTYTTQAPGKDVVDWCAWEADEVVTLDGQSCEIIGVFRIASRGAWIPSGFRVVRVNTRLGCVEYARRSEDGTLHRDDTGEGPLILACEDTIDKARATAEQAIRAHNEAIRARYT